ncbi:MAG: hypothetical protein P4L26_11070 [Terracidiphilus sp.]|nr:hypothetical protein [Terracidiphilus sp.]
MRILTSLTAAACALMAAAFLVTAAPVQAQEPNYLRALSDLRTARDYIQFDHRAEYGDERRHAIDEIDKAIAEIKRAAWDDGKNTRFAPPSGVTDPWYPLIQANRALEQARTNISQGVDTPENNGLRERALMHAVAANRIVSELRRQQRQ